MTHAGNTIRRTRPVAGALAAILLTAGCSAVTTAHPAWTADSGTPATVNNLGAPQVNSEIAKLNALPVKGRAPKTGYSRAQFGQAWSDDVTVQFGHNGCDTRNDILRRDLTNITIKPNTHGCTVLTGSLLDPYTGKTIEFTRGQKTSTAVQIDHIVPLSLDWQTGAQQLSADQRRNLANDPLNLQAVDGTANEQKSDGDAATWLPPNKAYRCTYVSRQVDVKTAYKLWVTPAEKQAIASILASCAHR